MRKARFWKIFPAVAVLAVAASAPAPLAAFWSGPGCFMANMMTGGMLSGGVGFSIGGRGTAYGNPYGSGYPYGLPYTVGPTSGWMSPAPPAGAEGRTPRRAAEILEANVWSSDARAPRAPGAAPEPRNRWQP
jgi:hypothetical protein